MPPGFHLLIAAQFVSALADNALLIVAIALLQQQGHPAWWAPLLKFFFTIAYVVLAPFVGPLADAFVKARLMMAMNALKVLGVLALLCGLNPLLAMAIIGVGAAAYAPAKYGLVTELVPARRLVAANGWIEVSTVCAVLLGAVLGGALISPAATRLALQGWPALAPLDAATALLLAFYALAALLNLGIPDSGARYRRAHRAPLALLRSFGRAQRRLWRDAEGGLSMAVTTLFWGAAAVMQFAVLRWAVDVLGLPLDRAAYLQAMVAVGIVAGAALAGHRVSLDQAWRVLPLGVAMGVAVPLLALVDHWLPALPLLAAAGALGGALVVPLNALLQHRGHQLLTAGRSIAVQNFNENLSVLVMLAAFAGLLALDCDIRSIMVALGLLVAGCVAVLYLRERVRRRGPAAAGVFTPPA
ncbi:lysophospholipid transporter LplT [Rubrivivax sp. A210]|uniref:lysophospholipid transporter LplT n=1 Tax=Rubrivivax sp. A210 TaxID=2772301 RepID=UPI0019192A62|nr:lysophospholipid transporter LplT [Rubrivivax sp. A210]